MSEMDAYYDSLRGTPVPTLLQCNICKWKGNKVKRVKFKKTGEKIFCPDCGSTHLGGTVELVFWRTANGYTNSLSFNDLVEGRYS